MSCVGLDVALPEHKPHPKASAEQDGNNVKGFENFCLMNGSNQGQDLALTVLYVPYSLDSGSNKVV
jgi:hypothetical protein